MNEKLQYAEMLNIPVNTSTITYKPKRKSLFKKKKDSEKVKEELIAKVNSENPVNREQSQAAADESAVSEAIAEDETTVIDDEPVSVPENYTPTVNIYKGKKKKREIKVNVIGIELAVVGILAAIIFLTSALVPTSGINVFFKEVFGNSQTTVSDTRKYDEFSATIPVAAANLTIENGVMNIAASSTVYSPCDGKITSLTLDGETKKYDMVITHNENFKTVIKGIDYAYAEMGGSVFSNIPVGYVKDSATLCFTDGVGGVITDYGISGGSVVWAV